MSQEQKTSLPGLLDEKRAHTLVVQHLHAPAFLSKLASLGRAARSPEEERSLLAIGEMIRHAEQSPEIQKAAGVTTDRYAVHRDALAGVLDQEQPSDRHYKQALAALSDQEVFAAAFSMLARQAA